MKSKEQLEKSPVYWKEKYECAMYALKLKRREYKKMLEFSQRMVKLLAKKHDEIKELKKNSK